ncbi:MAG TPA: hypothetical protein VGC97_08175 [Pyrinomonadaceae bacterium]|jgi:hypothetical protein
MALNTVDTEQPEFASVTEEGFDDDYVDLNKQLDIIKEISPVRIGVVFGDLGGLNVNSLKYLITHLNTLQKIFEYELLEIENDYIKNLKPEATVDRKKLRSKIDQLFSSFHKYIDDQQKFYNLEDVTKPDKFIIITLACFADGHYGLCEGDIQVMALGDWNKYMSPPTVFEFILTLLLRQSVGLISPSFSKSKHFGTKGCLFDFTPNISDARFKALQGFICSNCRKELKEDGYLDWADVITDVLKMTWIGDTKDVYSPAGIVKKLGYELFLTQGIKPTLWEALKNSLRDEGTKEFIKLVFAVVLAVLFIWLGLKK